ncbi:UNVERIFIED_CONTAM: hypothetical protein GTU68_058645 [Idotea baltica]|nr:hypothetical protein [Idotea baltica]
MKTPPITKSRLDTLVFERGLAQSRHQAQGLILSGRVLVNDTPVDKPGARIPDTAEVRIKGDEKLYVGRGGQKLAGALTHFSISVEGLVALDVGSSTGGFSDCMLQAGAKKVYAVDVGYNQLAHELRIDPRVTVMERTNAKDLMRDQFSEQPNFVTADLSFIGLEKVLPSVFPVCADSCEFLLLVKPQFELGPEDIAKGGVVRHEAKGVESVERVVEFLKSNGHEVVGWHASVLRGYKKGNQEYFVYSKKPAAKKTALIP